MRIRRKIWERIRKGNKEGIRGVSGGCHTLRAVLLSVNSYDRSQADNSPRLCRRTRRKVKEGRDRREKEDGRTR